MHVRPTFLLLLIVALVSGIAWTGCVSNVPPPSPPQPEVAPSPVPSTATPELAPQDTAPTGAPTPAEEAGPPAILHFSADPMSLKPGDKVVLSWAAEGATKAYVTPMQPNGQLSTTRWEVAPTGTLEVETEPTDRNWRGFLLTVENDAGQRAEQQLTITFSCPDIYFFSPDIERWGCPAGPPTYTFAAEQVFEGGRMIWLEDQSIIYVFYNEGPPPHWDVFEDTWKEGEPETDPGFVPPAGKLQPKRGFGKLWRNNPELRERLGWALAPEKGYSGAYQFDSCPGGTVASCGSLYLRTSDERVIRRPPERAEMWELLTP